LGTSPSVHERRGTSFYYNVFILLNLRGRQVSKPFSPHLVKNPIGRMGLPH